MRGNSLICGVRLAPRWLQSRDSDGRSPGAFIKKPTNGCFANMTRCCGTITIPSHGTGGLTWLRETSQPYQPKVLHAYPSSLYALAKFCMAEGLTLPRRFVLYCWSPSRFLRISVPWWKKVSEFALLPAMGYRKKLCWQRNVSIPLDITCCQHTDTAKCLIAGLDPSWEDKNSCSTCRRSVRTTSSI